MSLLMVNDAVSYNELKQQLNDPNKPLTDGNLASHLKKLRESDYIEETKEFRNRKPHTTYRTSKEGKKAFEAHLSALEEIIKGLG